MGTARLRRLRDNLCLDLEHCIPAEAVSPDYVAQRLRTTTRVLRGGSEADKEDTKAIEVGGSSAASRLDAELESALQRLLLILGGVDGSPGSAGDDAAAVELPQSLDAERVRSLFRALIKLLDRTSGAARV